MKTIKQFNISLIIRGLIIPIILVATILGGVRLNQKIVSLIDFGFTSKLATLASTAGAFVRFEDHDRLIQPRSMSIIRSGFGDSWLVLSTEGTIHTLHLDGSVSLEPTFSFLDSSVPLSSFATLNEHLFTLTENGQLSKWSNSGQLVGQLRVNTTAQSTLAASGTDEKLIFGPDPDQRMLVFNSNLEPVASFSSITDTVLDFNVNPSGQLVILTEAQSLVTINTETNEQLESATVSCSEADSCARIHSIAFNPNDTIWALSDALTMLSSDGMIDPDFYAHPNFHDHTTDKYLSYVVPMQEIREKQELTYLYSFVLNNEDKSISYVLDSSTNDDFTHIGYIDDELDLGDFIEGTDVLLTTKPYVSEIKPWGQWGLVKIGFAPIYRQDGRGGALMGADQNVSSIDQVSREALVILSLSSFVFLLFGATASWFIAKSLTSPLLELKDNVLSIAAGFLDRSVAEPKLKDLHPLAEVFKEAGNNLKKEVVHGPQILQKFETLRHDQDYRAFIELKIRDTSNLPCNLEWNSIIQNRIGWIYTGSTMLFWVFKTDAPNATSLLNSHNTLFQTCKGLLNNTFDSETMLNFLHDLNADTVDCLIQYNEIDHSFRVILSDEYILNNDASSVQADKIIQLHTPSLHIMTKDESPVLSITERNDV